ncbi:MAG: RluA family pseudouridine synthase, partial [Muribaculaceae bacterium]|nr:RluA family pseudouridine synthase [Muribaculaceae bacterium]
NYSGTLVNALAWHFRNIPDYDVNDPRLGLVHRIDKDTSGLLVIAKTPDAKTDLGRQFFNKTTKREYIALVWGQPEPSSGRIEGNIARSVRDRLQMDVFPAGGEVGKHAVTHYETIEKMGYVSLIKCVLETGRTHQIRVHMKHIGHPLFNDSRYGGDKILRGLHTAKYKQFIDNCFNICPRQALHARTLGFIHPATGQEMFFTAPIPDDMTALVEKWHKYVESVTKM